MFNPFKDYFYYTKSERNGTIGLVLLALFFFSLPTFYSFIFPTSETEYVSYLRELPDLNERFAARADTAQQTAVVAELFTFDPNRATAAEFTRLGLPDNTVKAIVNYRNKGGHFYKNADFKKIYTLTDADFLRLESYLNIPRKRTTKKFRRDTSGVKNFAKSTEKSVPLATFDPNQVAANTLLAYGLSTDVVNNILRYRAKGGKFYSAASLQKIYGLSQRDYARIAPYVQIAPVAYRSAGKDSTVVIRNNPAAHVDINQASVAEWQQLYGVGEYLAKKIVNFRTYLGGFSSIEQVGETYAVRPETFARIKPQLRFSPILKKLSINVAPPTELKKHPYLTWQQAQTIANFRRQHGHFMAAGDLVNTGIVTPAEIEKLAPYLDFSPVQQ